MSDGEILLDLEALAKVSERLAEALMALNEEPNNLFLLDSVIKRFELTYELTVRNLRRYLLDVVISDPDVEDKSFQGLIRIGARERLLLTGWPDWKDFKQARNQTVHSYHEPIARAVVETARAFLPEAQYLLKALQQRSGPDGAARNA